MAKYSILYRDASNYKDFIDVIIPDETLKVGDELTMEELGFSMEEFFEYVLERSTDSNEDHNYLEVAEILEETEEDFCLKIKKENYKKICISH